MLESLLDGGKKQPKRKASFRNNNGRPRQSRGHRAVGREQLPKHCGVNTTSRIGLATASMRQRGSRSTMGLSVGSLADIPGQRGKKSAESDETEKNNLRRLAGRNKPKVGPVGKINRKEDGSTARSMTVSSQIKHDVEIRRKMLPEHSMKVTDSLSSTATANTTTAATTTAAAATAATAAATAAATTTTTATSKLPIKLSLSLPRNSNFIGIRKPMAQQLSEPCQTIPTPQNGSAAPKNHNSVLAETTGQDMVCTEMNKPSLMVPTQLTTTPMDTIEPSRTAMVSTHPQTTRISEQPRKRKAIPVTNDNFVRLNLKNKHGACRQKKRKTNERNQRLKDQNAAWLERETSGRNQDDRTGNRRHGDDANQSESSKPGHYIRKTTIHKAVDPLDDYLDGRYAHKETTKRKQKTATTSSISTTLTPPCCSQHGLPCKELTVKKNTTGNKGRKFLVCSMPRGEQCDHFEWKDDTAQVRRCCKGMTAQMG